MRRSGGSFFFISSNNLHSSEIIGIEADDYLSKKESAHRKDNTVSEEGRQVYSFLLRGERSSANQLTVLKVENTRLSLKSLAV